jgi:hypothetical protein
MITTNKKINLEQLDSELGGYGLIADFNDPQKQIIGVAENSPITEEQLSEAVDNHIAGPSQEEIRLLNKQEGMLKLKELGFTDDQIKALIS